MLKDGRHTHALQNEDRSHRTSLIGALTVAICMIGVRPRKPHRPSRRRTQNPILLSSGATMSGFGMSAPIAVA